MPMSNGKYTAPTWVDGGAPALSAEELQAISDALAEVHGDFSHLKIAVGYYVGTGTNAEAYPTSLRFDFAPTLLCIYGYSSGAFSESNPVVSFSGKLNYWLPVDKLSTTYKLRHAPSMNDNTNARQHTYAKKSGDGKTIIWYSNYSAGEGYQNNESGAYYRYIAIGTDDSKG